MFSMQAKKHDAQREVQMELSSTKNTWEFV